MQERRASASDEDWETVSEEIVQLDLRSYHEFSYLVKKPDHEIELRKKLPHFTFKSEGDEEEVVEYMDEDKQETRTYLLKKKAE